jgi:DNA-binding MarR family transcriptional regulator
MGRSTATLRSGRTPLLLWLRLARLFQRIDRAAGDQLRCLGLSLAQFDVLAHIHAHDGGLTQQELADALLVSKGNVCQLLGRMEQRGLLERRQDGRANRLSLTAAGRALFERARPRHQALIAEQLSALSPEQQVRLLRLLRAADRPPRLDAASGPCPRETEVARSP